MSRSWSTIRGSGKGPEIVGAIFGQGQKEASLLVSRGGNLQAPLSTVYLPCTPVQRIWCFSPFCLYTESITYASSTPLLVRSPPPLPNPHHYQSFRGITFRNYRGHYRLAQKIPIRLRPSPRGGHCAECAHRIPESSPGPHDAFAAALRPPRWIVKAGS